MEVIHFILLNNECWIPGTILIYSFILLALASQELTRGREPSVAAPYLLRISQHTHIVDVKRWKILHFLSRIPSPRTLNCAKS